MQTNKVITKELSPNQQEKIWDAAIFITEKILLPFLQKQAEKRR